MDRARRASFALIGLLIVLLVASVGSSSSVSLDRTAAVSWPVSTGLLLAEVVTGGASASDEWIEITNAAPTPQDLGGLELVYVTSSGGTITRKAAWTAGPVLASGRHYLLANVSGIHAGIADATYSGGLAATGGALVLRPVGGAPIDAVGWGDATNAFVEGQAAPAPPAGSSIERRPGGDEGNGADTNDNAADWVVNAAPVAQPLAAPPVPGPSPRIEPSPSPSLDLSPSAGPSGEPSPTAVPSLEPSPTSVPSLEPSPTAVPSLEPSVEPTPSPSAEPTPSRSVEPTPSSSADPSPSPESSATPEPSATPDPSVAPSVSPEPSPVPILSIAAARDLPDGTPATVEGVLTIDLGSVDAGRGGFIQDPSGGVALYLDAAVLGPLPAGSLVAATGTLGDRYGQRTLRTSLADVAVLGPAPLPDAVDLPTGDAGESTEGRRVRVAGMVIESPTVLADGTGLTVDDGTGPVRVVVGAEALAGVSVTTGAHVEAVGPLGQRDSTGTGVTGYRVMTMLAGDLVVAAPAPSSSPSASPSAEPSTSPPPTPEPSGSPSPVPSPSPSPSVAPTPTPTPPVPASTIGSARLQPVGSFVRVTGVVTAEAGTLGKPPLLAIQDETAAIVVHLPDDVAGSPRGTHILVAGKLASVYGQLEVRPDAASIWVVGEEAPPEALAVRALDLGEGLEARLVTLVARVAAAPVRSTSGDLTVDVTDADGRPARVGVDGSRGIAREAFVRGRWYRFTGVEGQHSSRLGALDGYRVWLRDGADLVAVAVPSSSETPAPATGPTPGASASAGGAAATGDGTDEPPSSEPAVLSIASAIRLPDVDVAIEGVVTAGTHLLDASRRRLVLQDPTAAVEVLLPSPSTVRAGTRLRVVGTVGRAYGAPRIRADRVETLGTGEIPRPSRLTGEPSESLEWRLVQVSGRVDRLTRTGTSWRADLVTAGRRLLVVGLTGAAIPPARLTVGDAVTVTGIVRRPYPSATDRRFAVVPRTLADVAVGRGTSGAAATPVATSRGAAAETGTATSSGDSGAELVDLARIREFVGRSVRVAGLVAELTGDELWLDDGTATAPVVLGEQARAAIADLQVGDAVEARGVVVQGSDGTRLQVDDPAGIVLAGAVVAAPGASTSGPSPAPSPASDAAVLPGKLDGLTPTVDLAGSVIPPFLAVLLAFAGVAITLRLRRRGAERVARAVLARRLASIPVSPAAPRVATGADEPGHVHPGTLRAG